MSNQQSWNDACTVTVIGEQAVDFLQGYLTSDVTNLVPGRVTPTALCNLKGRVVLNGWLYMDAEEPGGEAAEVVRIVVHQSLADRLVAFLKPYAQFSRCQLRVESLAVGVISGQQNGNLVADWSITPHSVMAAQNPTEPAADASKEICRALVNSDHAWVSMPCSEQFLPQMLGLAEVGAVDFQKGCYLGQEVVARAQFRGAVKRKLMRTSWRGEPPGVGQKHEDLGTVISVATEVGSQPEGQLLAVK